MGNRSFRTVSVLEHQRSGDFWEDGVKDVIEGSANTAFAGMPANAPKLHLAINNPTLLVGGDFDTPVWNAAVFHQSTLNDLL